MKIKTKTQYWRKLLPLLFVMAFIYGCSKEIDDVSPSILETDLQRADPVNINSIKGAFYGSKFDEKLSDRISDTFIINWLPVWQQAFKQRDKNQEDYTYIPLNSEIKTGQARTTSGLELRGVKRFIIVKHSADELIFSLATYNFDGPSATNKELKMDPHSFRSFTGSLLLKDLNKGTVGLAQYKNGVRVDTAPDGIATLSGDVTTQGWECQVVYTCYWGYAGGCPYVYATSTKSVDGFCDEPRWTPSECSWGGSWYSNGQQADGQECVYVEDPPLPGDGGSCGSCTPPGYGNTPVPCPGDAVKSPKITPSSGWNTQGGRFGHTRSEGTQLHDGLDITVPPGTPLGAMYGGTVVRIENSFPAGKYKYKSYGNYVVIRSTLPNGETIEIKYNHLDRVDVAVGTTVHTGSVMGLSGTTGNAHSKGVTPHVHIQVNKNGVSVNPEDYHATKFDASAKSINTPC